MPTARKRIRRDHPDAVVIAAVADYVALFDKQVDHPWRLSDTILLKFNLISKRRVRKTPEYEHARAVLREVEAVFGYHDALSHDTDREEKQCDRCRVLEKVRKLNGN